jgi:hypothetical protein
MQSTSPIRRYVLLRHRGLDAGAARWSLEPIASTPRGAAPAAPGRQPAKRARERLTPQPRRRRR